MKRFPAVLAATVLLVATLATPASAALPTPAFEPEIDAYADYEGQSTCDPSPKPGAEAFRDVLKAEYKRGGDIISRDCGAGGQSEHKEGRALDYWFKANDSAQKKQATELLDWLLATDEHGNAHARARRLGIMYIIWNREIWQSYAASEGWQPYTGASPHTDHIHFSFSWAGARKQTTWWTSAQPVR